MGKSPAWPAQVPWLALAHVAAALPGPSPGRAQHCHSETKPRARTLTLESTLGGTAGSHIGVKMLEGTSEVGLYQTQGTLDAFVSLQMKRQQWPALSLSS